MLSLLSLLLASGTVLRADTERWTPLTYPNPRRNHTGCNTWENSTLCDPDHILTDQWRSQINENIKKQMQKLTEANVPLAEKAPAECANRTEGVTIYVLLAKRIWTPENKTITGNDLTNFGDELAKQYGLNELPCKTFLLLIGIEAAKLAYVRTGKDLRLPADLMQRVFHEYKLFNAKNFMAGLNKIVDEIGDQMADPFKDQLATTVSGRLRPNNNATSTSTDSTTSLAEIVEEMEKSRNGTEGTPGAVDGEVEGGEGGRRRTAPWWMFLSLGAAILLSFGSLALLAVAQQKRQAKATVANNNNNNEGMMQTMFGNGQRQQQQMGVEMVEEGKGMVGLDGEEEGIEMDREGRRAKGKTSVSKADDDDGEEEECSSSASLGGQCSSDFEEMERAESAAPRVRIGAAELATDVIDEKKRGEKEKEEEEKEMEGRGK